VVPSVARHSRSTGPTGVGYSRRINDSPGSIAFRSLRQQPLQIGLHPVLAQPRVVAERDRGLEVDGAEGDGQPLPLGVGDHPAVALVEQVVGGIHPVERLVGAAVGMDGDTAVGLHHHQPGRHGEMGGEPSLVVNGAFGHDDPHRRRG